LSIHTQRQVSAGAEQGSLLSPWHVPPQPSDPSHTAPSQLGVQQPGMCAQAPQEQVSVQVRWSQSAQSDGAVAPLSHSP
jgi:hypothetical protein